MKVSGSWNAEQNIILPPSKSHLNRLLILAAISVQPKEIRIHCHFDELPEDSKDLINALKKVGLTFEIKLNSFKVKNSFPESEPLEKIIDIPIQEGGTTLRFLLALLSLGKNKYRVFPDQKLLDRPSSEFKAVFKDLNVHYVKKKNHFEIQGPAKKDCHLSIDCRRSTQFASAFYLLKSKMNWTISPKNLNSSASYYQLSQQILSEHLSECDKDKMEIECPADWSSASYVIAYALLNKKLTITNLTSLDPNQADAKLLDILSERGGRYTLDTNGLTIQPSRITSLDCDCSQFLDLVPTLVYLAIFTTGTHQLNNLQNLEHKESNRLEALISILDQLGCQYHLSNFNLTIKTPENFKYSNNFPLEIPPDHRLVMMATLITKQLGGGEIKHEECVSKSFPAFFTYFR